MKIFDISLPISEALPVWPGDPDIVLTPIQSLATGHKANVSRIECSVHTGTHVDAPSHFLENGITVDRIPLDGFMGDVFVAWVPDEDEVSPEVLNRLNIPEDTQRLLLRTRNSELWAQRAMEFTPNYVALTPEAAMWIVARDIRLVGVDYLSVQRFHDPDPTTHHTLLSAGVIIVEGLNLWHVPSGQYELVCLPIRLENCDGAPARAILIAN